MGVVDLPCGMGVSERLWARLPHPHTYLEGSSKIVWEPLTLGYWGPTAPCTPGAEIRPPNLLPLRGSCSGLVRGFLQGYLKTLDSLLSRSVKLTEGRFLNPPALVGLIDQNKHTTHALSHRGPFPLPLNALGFIIVKTAIVGLINGEEASAG